uniref:Fibronectin type-III domain-containing protein n=1 Tax=Hucho hucho TaxID=62062 RepID=A0A4W5MS57_9TELE
MGYYVEKMRADGTEFDVANRKLCTDLHIKLENLSENHVYQFRVFAVTEVGEGERSKPISANIQDDEIPPEISILEHFKRDTIIVRKGAAIEIPAEVVGLPMPEVQWSKDDVVIPMATETLLMEFEEVARTKCTTKISIPETIRGDKGDYKLAA